MHVLIYFRFLLDVYDNNYLHAWILHVYTYTGMNGRMCIHVSLVFSWDILLCKEKESAITFDIFLYRALYRTLPDAGTLLSFDPFSSPMQYKNNDLIFRNKCCGETGEGGGCDLYLQRRPINMGTDYSDPSMCMDETKIHCIIQYNMHEICMNIFSTTLRMTGYKNVNNHQTTTVPTHFFPVFI